MRSNAPHVALTLLCGVSHFSLLTDDADASCCVHLPIAAIRREHPGNGVGADLMFGNAVLRPEPASSVLLTLGAIAVLARAAALRWQRRGAARGVGFALIHRPSAPRPPQLPN